MLTVGSLFSGIGGFDLGMERAGMSVRWQCEIDKAARGVLRRHWPEVTCYEDVRDVGIGAERVDVVVGGFPCQDVSVAGRRAGLAGERSGLWFEFLRVVCAIRPRWVVVENVRGLLTSHAKRDFGTVLGGLAGGGYDAEWDCLPACAFGAPHTRERLFIIAYPTGRRFERDVFDVVAQKVQYLSSQTLGTWNGISHPQSHIQKLMGQPGHSVLADGVSSEVAIRPALRMFGNAVVPIVAQSIGMAIAELEGDGVIPDDAQLIRRQRTEMREPVAVRAQNNAVINGVLATI